MGNPAESRHEVHVLLRCLELLASLIVMCKKIPHPLLKSPVILSVVTSAVER